MRVHMTLVCHVDTQQLHCAHFSEAGLSMLAWQQLNSKEHFVRKGPSTTSGGLVVC